MSKQWYAFFKRAIVCVAVSSGAAYAVEPVKEVNLPTFELVFVSQNSGKEGTLPRVGDVVPYEIRRGEPNWQIDPKEGALTKGYLFRKGKLFIPLVPAKIPLPSLTIIDLSGTPVGKTDPVEIEAISNLKTNESAQPGQPPKPEPPVGPLGLPFPLWIQSVVGFLILAIALVSAFFLLRALKRRAAKALKALGPKKPYDLIVLERLDALEKDGLIGKRQYKAFYFTISHTLKFYLAERYKVDAQECTTLEMIFLLRDRMGMNGLNEDIVLRVERLFDSLDPVKFADHIPTDTEANETLREARSIVSSTRDKTPELLSKDAPRGRS